MKVGWNITSSSISDYIFHPWKIRWTCFVAPGKTLNQCRHFQEVRSLVLLPLQSCTWYFLTQGYYTFQPYFKVLDVFLQTVQHTSHNLKKDWNKQMGCSVQLLKDWKSVVLGVARLWPILHIQMVINNDVCRSIHWRAVHWTLNWSLSIL